VPCAMKQFRRATQCRGAQLIMGDATALVF
jgi:hypothetical protein